MASLSPSGDALAGECTDVEVPIDYDAPDVDTAQVRAFRPAVGALDLDFVTSTVSGAGLRLAVMNPVDPVTDARLHRLAEIMQTRA